MPLASYEMNLTEFTDQTLVWLRFLSFSLLSSLRLLLLVIIVVIIIIITIIIIIIIIIIVTMIIIIIVIIITNLPLLHRRSLSS